MNKAPYLGMRAPAGPFSGVTYTLQAGMSRDVAEARITEAARALTPPREWDRIIVRLDDRAKAGMGGRGQWILGRAPAWRQTVVTDVEA